MTSKLETARQWFEISRLDHGVTRIAEPHVDPFLRCNIWHIRGRDHDLLVDTGLGLAPLLPSITAFAGREPWTIATHAHFDHIGGIHEFSVRLAHSLDAPLIVAPDFASVRVDDYPRALRLMFPEFESGQELLTAYPNEGFDPAAYRVQGAPVTRLVEDGDVLDLGGRTLTVLHLPGHSPGSIGLWEAETGLLFTGDALYEGELLGDLPESDPHAYVATMERLRAMPATTVHAGHGESFGRERSVELIDAYLGGLHS